MNKSIDWSEWILQKNNEAKQEELKKSDFVSTDILKKGAPAVAPTAPPEGGDDSDSPKKGKSVFSMDHVNQVAAMSNHAEAKKLAHSAVDSSNANPENKKKIKLMIDRSKSPAHLAQAMAIIS